MTMTKAMNVASALVWSAAGLILVLSFMAFVYGEL
jgi:hypothetical protein